MKKVNLRRPGIEPGAKEWESLILPLNYRRVFHTGSAKLCKYNTHDIVLPK